MGALKATGKEYEKLNQNALRGIAKGEFTEEQATVILDLQKQIKQMKAKMKKLEKRVATVDSRSGKLWVRHVQEDLEKGTNWDGELISSEGEEKGK